MVIPKEILTDYKEIYEKAVKLVNEESKNDPADDPYKSHYTARNLLLEMKEMLKNSLVSVLAEEADDGKDDLVYQVIQAFVCRDLGRIYLFTEETSLGENSLRECIDLIKGKKTRPESIIAYMGAVNELGIAYANRMEYKQSLELLSEVETCYREFNKSENKPMSITDIFGTPEEIEVDKGTNEFESLYTLCCFYLAQVYGHLGELEKSAQYCHMTLKRQYSAQNYEPIDFALNSATLSQYFIGQNMFKEARHHLAAATLIIAEYESKISHTDNSISEQEFQDLQETFKHRYADVARCWSKYGLSLLASSKERLFNDDDEKLVTDAKNLQIDSNRYCFPPDMPLENYESRISCDYCLTFDDAKEVYHFVIKWLDQAKEYYKPDTEASEYAKIIKDFADLYEQMAFFEEDPSNQSKMQKRRAKYYEELLELLNPSFYLNICRECWYGAGLSYCAILDIKLDCFKSTASPNPQELHKINQVCQNAIKHFKSFIQSYTEKDGSIKANIDVDEQKTWLYSHFHLGRLHYKMITPDQKLQLENLSNSLKYYKAFTEECVKLAEASKSLQAEIGVCREMVNLLPIKMSKVRKRLEK
ncbi:KIF-binding protein [Glossina fuscipes]|uniref:KIF-binding protein n=1 Tax=Glossina fuscipes TaxID=7396 RepID=A0A8U0WDI7_9MUSC|nr:KIF-binding protein [Glossina fuscipes]